MKPVKTVKKAMKTMKTMKKVMKTVKTVIAAQCVSDVASMLGESAVKPNTTEYHAYKRIFQHLQPNLLQ